jgi:hypothetical protein
MSHKSTAPGIPYRVKPRFKRSPCVINARGCFCRRSVHIPSIEFRPVRPLFFARFRLSPDLPTDPPEFDAQARTPAWILFL